MTGERFNGWLFVHILSSTVLQKRFVQSMDDENVVFKTSELLKYHSSIDKVMSLLLTLIHLTYGQPARATELETWCLNDLGDKRSIYLLSDTICFLGRYHKSLSKTGHFKLIPRYVPVAVAELLRLFFAIIRPFQVATITAIHPSTRMDLFASRLFLMHGRPMTDESISSTFQRVYLLYAQSEMTFQNYRHATEAFIERLFWRFQSADRLPFEMQAGHTSATAQMHYAISNEDLKNVSKETLNQFYLCSKAWHELIGFKVTRISIESF